MAKQRKPTQGELLRSFGEVCSFVVGESAQHPGEGQISQYSSQLVGPLTPTQLRALAANLNACADALDADDVAQRAAIVATMDGTK